MPRRTPSKLTDEQKAFVVQRLACWDTPQEASDALKAEHGVSLTPQGCECYDPNKRAGKNLSKKWRDLFEITRKNFLTDIEMHVPEANKAVRVRHLAHAAQAFKRKGNYIAMKDMLESVAKELGNVHTNKREFTGKDGKPIEVEYKDMTDEQLTARLVHLMSMAIEGGGSDGAGA